MSAKGLIILMYGGPIQPGILSSEVYKDPTFLGITISVFMALSNDDCIQCKPSRQHR